MKIWQLRVCMEFERQLLNQYFGNIDLIVHGTDDVEDNIVVSVLSQSNKIYSIDSANILRVYRQGMINVQTMTILEAYNLYGGDAITEAIDYGSYKVS